MKGLESNPLQRFITNITPRPSSSANNVYAFVEDESAYKVA